MKHSLQYGCKEIFYFLEFTKRVSLGITITPGMEVVVRAPYGTDLEKIEEKLRKRATWIIKQQSYFLRFHPRTPDKQYISGESHFYLGRQYKLKIIDGIKNGVHFNGREILLTKRPKSAAKDVLLAWYRMKAKQVFADLAEPLIVRFQKYNVSPSEIYLQAMPTRWGSCTPGGKIILNPELMKAPRRCIEYVILHELCHLVHRGHTAAFFRLQAAEMPDWEQRKEKLEGLLA